MKALQNERVRVQEAKIFSALAHGSPRSRVHRTTPVVESFTLDALYERASCRHLRRKFLLQPVAAGVRARVVDQTKTSSGRFEHTGQRLPKKRQAPHARND